MRYLILFILPFALNANPFGGYWDGITGNEVQDTNIISQYTLPQLPHLLDNPSLFSSSNAGTFTFTGNTGSDTNTGTGSDNTNDDTGSGTGTGVGTVLSNDWTQNDDGSNTLNKNVTGLFTTDPDGNVINTDEWDPSWGPTPFTTEVQMTQSSGGDMDNDVPTLLQILAKLEQIRATFDPQTSSNSESDEETPIEEFTDNFDIEDVMPEDINPLANVTPSGTMPNTSLYVPTIGAALGEL